MKLPETVKVEELTTDDLSIVRMTKKHYKKGTESSACPMDLRYPNRRDVAKINKIRMRDQRTVYRIVKYRPHLTKTKRILWRQDEVLIDNLVEGRVSNRDPNSSGFYSSKSGLFSLAKDGEILTEFGDVKKIIGHMDSCKDACLDPLIEAGVVRPIFIKVSSWEIMHEAASAKRVGYDLKAEKSDSLNLASNVQESSTSWVPLTKYTPKEIFFKWPDFYRVKGYAGMHNKDYFTSDLTAHERARTTRTLAKLGWVTK